MVKPKEGKEAYSKCRKGSHSFRPSLDPWFEKCLHCPAVRQVASVKVKSQSK